MDVAVSGREVELIVSSPLFRNCTELNLLDMHTYLEGHLVNTSILVRIVVCLL